MTEDTLEVVRDPARLAALREADLLPSIPEESFDRITRLAARLLDAPLALVNLVEEDRQVSKSCFASPEAWPSERELPLADSFCRYAVASGRPLRIENAREDPRVAGSRAVTEQGLRSYLGIPLVTEEGHALGTLCVADLRERAWTEEQVEVLEDLAATVMTEIGLRAALRRTARAEDVAEVATRERREKTALLQSTNEGIYGIDNEGRCTFINRAGAEMIGYTPEECLGRNMHGLIHHHRTDGSPYPEKECPIYRAFREGRPARVEDEVLWRKDGTAVPVSYSSSPMRQDGTVQGAVVAFNDITERKREEAKQQFLAEASKVLAASSLDYAATLKSLMRLAVPALADWCSIYVVREDGALERLEITHADPEKAAEAERLKGYAVDPRGAHPASQVIRTGEPVLLRDIPAERLEAIAQDEDHLRVLRELGLRSAIVVPLTARGRAHGAITLVSAESGRRYSEEDLSIAQEFAHRAALAVENARLYRDSQEANRSKSEFLATISHELRTPLNAAIGYASLLREGVPEPLPAGSLEYVERIELSTRHLRQLIEEILTFARLEANREVVSISVVPLSEVFEELGAILQPTAEDRGLDFRVEPPEEEIRLETDPAKVRQILLNLLDNAIKFTREGTVALSARQEAERVILEVKDTGVGIAPEDAERIFDPFVQVEQSSTREVGGTGLGLSVTRRLVELLDGTLQLESEPGRGSTFRVELPLRRPEAAGRGGEPSEGDR